MYIFLIALFLLSYYVLRHISFLKHVKSNNEDYNQHMTIIKSKQIRDIFQQLAHIVNTTGRQLDKLYCINVYILTAADNKGTDRTIHRVFRHLHRTHSMNCKSKFRI